MGSAQISASPAAQIVALAEWLHAQQRLPLRELAEKAGYHMSTLSRATSGEKVPRWPVVEAYTMACGAPVEQARVLWQQARRAEYRQRLEQRGLRLGPAPLLSLVHDRADLSAAMIELWTQAGCLTGQEMEEIAKRERIGKLPHSTANRLIRKKAVPLSRQQFGAFLAACGVTAGDQDPWLEAWARVWTNEDRRSLARAGQRDRMTSQHKEFIARSSPDPLPVLAAVGSFRSTSEIASRAGIAPSTARARLKKLRELGLVQAVQRGRSRVYLRTELGGRVLKRIRTLRQPASEGRPERQMPSPIQLLLPNRQEAVKIPPVAEVLYEDLIRYVRSRGQFPATSSEFSRYLLHTHRLSLETGQPISEEEVRQILPDLQARYLAESPM